MSDRLRSIADFGEAVMDAEEDDCWLLLGDVTKAILARSAPPQDRPSGRVSYAAFPGRSRKERTER